MMSWEGATIMLFLVTTLVAVHSGKLPPSHLPLVLLSFACGLRSLRDHGKGPMKLKGLLRLCLCSEFLVSSIETVVTDYGLPESFIGVILLPIVGMFSWATAENCLPAKYGMALLRG